MRLRHCERRTNYTFLNVTFYQLSILFLRHLRLSGTSATVFVFEIFSAEWQAGHGWTVSRFWNKARRNFSRRLRQAFPESFGGTRPRARFIQKKRKSKSIGLLFKFAFPFKKNTMFEGAPEREKRYFRVVWCVSRLGKRVTLPPPAMRLLQTFRTPATFRFRRQQ